MTNKYLQWELVASEEVYNLFNLGPDGKKQYYEIVMGQYGQPIIVAEPDRAFPCPEMLTYVDAKGNACVPAEKIAGIIAFDGKTDVKRYSLTNAAKQGIKIEVQGDGSIKINDEIWWIKTLFGKDKNRVVNYDAYLSPDKPEKVKILELADLTEFFCS